MDGYCYANLENTPPIMCTDPGHLQSIQSLLPFIDAEHLIGVETLKDQFWPAVLEQESISSFIVVPGSGSRKRVADILGNLPERLAASFDGNLVILHFDR